MKRYVIAVSLAILLAFTVSLTPAAVGEEISYGKEYSLVTPASSAYPDDGLKLTDGIYGSIPEDKNSYYTSNAYVGFNRENVDSDGNFVVIIDLGSMYNNIKEFTVGYLNEPSSGVRAPKSVAFAVSDLRNGEYHELGAIDTATNSDTSETFAKKFTAEENLTGQFVRITITPAESSETDSANWTFIDEIAVHSADDSDATESESSDTVSDTTDSSDITDGSDVSESSDISDETSDGTPQTGDSSFDSIAFVLLALSAIALAFALFTRRRNS